MLRLLSRRLQQAMEKRLANGTVLKGVLNPKHPNQLLEGITVLPDGRAFRGKYHESVGYPLPGSRLEEDGDLYEGEFNVAWQREGKGRAWLADGTSYEGRFQADELVEGVVRIPQGTSELVFEGTLRDEAFVRGRLSSPDYVYEGEFKDNEPDGKGKLVFSSGGEQEGQFRHGKLHGNDCKMKLEGGFVYVGEFLDGHIRYGKLFTPTYTYEGEFNEHGKAHGTGSQIYLINEPRLTFTGIWNNGAMVRGSVVDEYGTPVDWKNDHDLQRSVLGGGDETLGEERVAMNSYCSAKLKEADDLHREMNTSYVEDAMAVARQTGSFPSKMDLRYEGGIREEQENSHLSSYKQMQDLERCRERSRLQTENKERLVEEAKQEVVTASINTNMAKINFARQFGAQELSEQRADEQLNRFLRTFNHRKASASILDEDGDEEEGNETATEIDHPTGDKDTPKENHSSNKNSTNNNNNNSNTNSAATAAPTMKLNIEGNAPWKSFTPPPRS